MSRPIHAEISFSALAHNLSIAQRHARSRVMAVVKADAYGHGVLRVAQALRNAEGFALLDIHEAIQLREAGFSQTLLLLEGFFSADELLLAAEYDIACVVHGPDQLMLLDACPQSAALSVWLKINTGMNRLGFAERDVHAAMDRLKSSRAVRDITLMTHFATADEPRGIALPLERFVQVAGDYRLPRSMANSAALLRFPESHGDWVRPGIMLYGASPFADKSASEFGLRPVMTLRSAIIAVRDLQAGDCVGYGSTYCADAPTRVGIVACGYADGYPRHAPTGTPLLVDGQRTRTLGRVSMDMLAVDLSACPNAAVGSSVTLWGEGLSVDEVAAASGTLGYELLCALAPRVPTVTD